MSAAGIGGGVVGALLGGVRGLSFLGGGASFRVGRQLRVSGVVAALCSVLGLLVLFVVLRFPGSLLSCDYWWVCLLPIFPVLGLCPL